MVVSPHVHEGVLDPAAIAAYLGYGHPVPVALLIELRQRIISVLPAHRQQLRWRALAFDKPGARATVKDNICHLKPIGRRVRMSLPLGVFFEDPQGLLRGDFRYKRFLDFRDRGDLERLDWASLLLQSYHFDSNRVLYKLLPSGEYKDLASRI
jgi:hypothetical protein